MAGKIGLRNNNTNLSVANDAQAAISNRHVAGLMRCLVSATSLQWVLGYCDEEGVGKKSGG